VAGETWLPTTKAGASGGSGSFNHTYNFGQDSSFAGNKTAQGNTDENGIGDFYYAPPSGYLALCTSNLPEPTIGPNSLTQADDHFETILYSASSGSAGAGSSTAQDIGGLDFKPDWVWIKGRSYADHHALFDSSRGVGKYLLSSSTNAEGNVADTLDEFRSDGFGLGADSTALVNYQNNTYVSWNWKANGGTTTTNDASATSVGDIDSVYQANTTAGFSIVTWTGIADDTNNTIAHGLGVTPAMHMTKSRSTNSAGHWMVWHQAVSDTRDNLFLNLTNATNAQGFGGSTPTNNSTVFETSQTTYTNVSGDDYVSYVFSEVEGYSKFGSYTGNGSTDGPFVYLGFRPAFLMYKRTDSTGNWLIDDNKTQTFNPDSNYLVADSSDAEGDTTTNTAGHVFDMLSNGFKMRNTNSARNASGGTFIYMAFAEAPFKYANAR